jgi:hypothetical protein
MDGRLRPSAAAAQRIRSLSCRASSTRSRSTPTLHLIGRSDSHVGDVSGFAPPANIHRVAQHRRHATAISIHVYGRDVTRVGSSAHR